MCGCQLKCYVQIYSAVYLHLDGPVRSFLVRSILGTSSLGDVVYFALWIIGDNMGPIPHCNVLEYHVILPSFYTISNK